MILGFRQFVIDYAFYGGVNCGVRRNISNKVHIHFLFPVVDAGKSFEFERGVFFGVTGGKPYRRRGGLTEHAVFKHDVLIVGIAPREEGKFTAVTENTAFHNRVLYGHIGFAVKAVNAHTVFAVFGNAVHSVHPASQRNGDTVESVFGNGAVLGKHGASDANVPENKIFARLVFCS